MPIPFRIKTHQTQPPDVSARKWREFSREGHAEQGQVYHRKMLPRHFISGISSKIYGYRKRTAKYLARKSNGTINIAGKQTRAIEGGSTDLVFTGRLRQLLLSFAAIRAFPSRVTITTQFPAYAPPRPRTLRNPPIVDEATRVNPRDRDDLSRILSNTIHERLEKYRQPRTTDTG